MPAPLTFGETRVKVAIIGSRGPSADQEETAAYLASTLSKAGYVIATGGARGIDEAAMAATEPGMLEVYLPWESYGAEIIPAHARKIVYYPRDHPEWHNSVKIYHPAANRLCRADSFLMARNYGIIAGAKLVIALPWRTSRLGGTGHGIRIAEGLGIPLIVDLGQELFSTQESVLNSALQILAA